MIRRQTRKFDISSRLEQKKDDKIHFTRLHSTPRRSPRPLWSTIVMMLILLMIFLFLKRLM